MEQRKRKTGLGIDAFFPGAAPGTEEMASEEPARREEPPAPSGALSPVEEGLPKMTMVAKRRVARSGRSAAAMEKEPAAKSALKTEMVKLTVMIRQDQFDNLERLKDRERKRLRQEGGDAAKRWRQEATVTKFVSLAIDELLAKRGLKKKP